MSIKWNPVRLVLYLFLSIPLLVVEIYSVPLFMERSNSRILEAESENIYPTEAEEEYFVNILRTFAEQLFDGTSSEDYEDFFETPIPTFRVLPDYRVLTPIDLTKPFVFDDEEEIATANSTWISMDYDVSRLDFFPGATTSKSEGTQSRQQSSLWMLRRKIEMFLRK